VPAGIADTVVNKTAIDRKTNQRIGKSAPSKYLEVIEKAKKISSEELDEIVQSHDIDPVLLRQDDFAGFFNRRFERLLKQIEEAMGKPVNRRADASESPFRESAKDAAKAAAAIRSLMATPESKVLEFKSTGRKNLHTGEKDAHVEWAIVKTIAAFMNTAGGTLLMGVDDNGKPVGVEQDFAFLNKADQDGWELWLTDGIKNSLGKVPASEMAVTISEIDEHQVARIDVGPSAEPVFASTLKREKSERFYARINNRTEEVTGQDLHKYLKRRWPH
jgi:hypothetical protein